MKIHKTKLKFNSSKIRLIVWKNVGSVSSGSSTEHTKWFERPYTQLFRMERPKPMHEPVVEWQQRCTRMYGRYGQWQRLWRATLPTPPMGWSAHRTNRPLGMAECFPNRCDDLCKWREIGVWIELKCIRNCSEFTCEHVRHFRHWIGASICRSHLLDWRRSRTNE